MVHIPLILSVAWSGLPFPSLPLFQKHVLNAYFKYVCMCQSFSHIQLFVTPMDYNLPGSSVRGILQARILEWIVIPFSRVSSQPRDRTQVSSTADGLFPV